MTLKDKRSLIVAEVIWQEFGAYIATSLESLVFGLNIPQSLLPYPKEKIEEALKIGMEYCKITNNKKGMKIINNGLEMLSWYKDDHKCINIASKLWGSKKFREYVLRSCREFQERNHKKLVKQIEEKKVSL